MNTKDKSILKSLSVHVHEIAKKPEEGQKRELWRRHTSLKGTVPPVFVSPEGSWTEIFPEESLECEDAFAREIELELRKRIFRHEIILRDTHSVRNDPARFGKFVKCARNAIRTVYEADVPY